MKKLLTLLLVAAMLPNAVLAAVSFNVNMGPFADSLGADLSDGTLIALIVDANNDGVLLGGLSENNSLTDGTAIQNDFANATIEVGALGSDYILAVSDINGLAVGGAGFEGFWSDSLPSIDTASSGAPTNALVGVYWFTGRTLASNTLGSSGFEVGGINETAQTDDGGAMRLPASGTVGYNVTPTSFGFGGNLPDNRFEAVVAVPEPSAAILALLGAGALFLRRRR